MIVKIPPVSKTGIMKINLRNRLKEEGVGEDEVDLLGEVSVIENAAIQEQVNYFKNENKRLCLEIVELKGILYGKDNDIKEKDITISKLEQLLQESYKRLQTLSRAELKQNNESNNHQNRIAQLEAELAAVNAECTSYKSDSIRDKEISNKLSEKVKESIAILSKKKQEMETSKLNNLILTEENTLLKGKIVDSETKLQEFSVNYDIIVKKHNDLLVENANHFHVIVENQEKLLLLNNSYDSLHQEYDILEESLSIATKKLEEEELNRKELEESLYKLRLSQQSLLETSQKLEHDHHLLKSKYIKSEEELKKHVDIINLINTISHKKETSFINKENINVTL